MDIRTLSTTLTTPTLPKYVLVSSLITAYIIQRQITQWGEKGMFPVVVALQSSDGNVLVRDQTLLGSEEEGGEYTQSEVHI